VPKLDCIYIAASTHDMRFARICVASIRYLYPDVPIRLLMGLLRQDFADELKQYWNVDLADVPRGNYGWGYICYQSMFGPAGERFLYLDSDTIIAGPVLDWAEKRDEDFIVDNEVLPPDVVKSMYLDVEQSVREGNPIHEPEFLFNGGQWFGTSGLIGLEDFKGLIEWGFPPRILNPRVFKQENQGPLNFVLNEKRRAGKITVASVPLMYWPGRGMQGVNIDQIIRKGGPPLVIHWAGLKKARLCDMEGAELLRHFEKFYYARLPGGEAKRLIMACGHTLAHWKSSIKLRINLRSKAIAARLLKLLGKH